MAPFDLLQAARLHFRAGVEPLPMPWGEDEAPDL
jgi:hypothetical protein